jgi:hypothetical protein
MKPNQSQAFAFQKFLKFVRKAAWNVRAAVRPAANQVFVLVLRAEKQFVLQLTLFVFFQDSGKAGRHFNGSETGLTFGLSENVFAFYVDKVLIDGYLTCFEVNVRPTE